MGNKTPLLHRIQELIPTRIDTFVEVFGGSAALTLALPKQKGVRYVLNDYNQNLANLYRCVREKPFQLARELQRYHLNSQADFSLYLHLLDADTIRSPEEKEAVERLRTVALSRAEDSRELDAAAQLGLDEEQLKRLRQSLDRRAELFDVKQAAMFAINQQVSFGSGGTSFGGKPVSFDAFALSFLRNHERLDRVVIRCAATTTTFWRWCPGICGFTGRTATGWTAKRKLRSMRRSLQRR